jgi:DNA polymerase-3 subunit delta
VATDEIIKKIKRYYLFYGNNDFRRKERIKSLIKTVIPPGGEAFDLDQFDGKGCDAHAVLNSLSTPPAMSPLRVVILTNAEKLSPNNQKILNDFLEKIPDYSVLTMTASKTDKRSPLFKYLHTKEKVHTYVQNDYSNAELIELVRKFAFDRKKDISPNIAAMIVDIYGTEPFRLENEVEKIAIFSGDKKEIEKKDLAFSAGFNKVETAYDLADFIIEGQLNGALALTNRALVSGINEMQLIFLLKNHFSKLNTAINSNDIKSLMSKSRVPSFVARKIMTQSKKIGPKAILTGLKSIFQAEYSIKSARFKSETIMELLVTKLIFEVAGNKSRI